LARVRAAGEPTTPEDLAAMCRPKVGVPDSTQAWQGLMGSLKGNGLGKPPYGLTILDRSGTPDPPRKDWQEYRAAKDFLEQRKPFFAELDAALATPGDCAFLSGYDGGYMLLLPHAQQLRLISRLLVLRAYVAEHENDASGVARNLKDILNATAILKREPIIVSQLIRAIHNRVALEGLEYFLPVVEFSDEQLADLQKALAAVDYREGMIAAIEGERVLGLMAFSDPGSAGARYVPAPVYQVWINDDPYHFLTVMRQLVEAARTDWPGPLELTAAYSEQLDVPGGVKSPFGGRWEVPSKVVVGARRLFERTAIETARIRAASAGVAAVRFRRLNGRWPSSLEELTPQWLESVPLDSCTGGPLRLATDGKSLRIYSVGLDSKDDGGVETPELENGTPHRHGNPDIVFSVRAPESRE
jgi:hypothetical protein